MKKATKRKNILYDRWKLQSWNIFTCERSKHRWMYRSCNYNDCSNSNTNCKITAYARDIVLCDVRWGDAKDCSYGDRKNNTNVLGVFS